ADKPSPRLWLAGIGEAARADLAWFEEDGGRVRGWSARFYARPPGEDWHLVAEVAGDPADPAAGLRGLAAPLQPHRPGLWVFRAEADLVYSGMDPEEEMALRTLGSPELQAELLDLPDPLWLEYAELASRNLLRRAKVAAHASSESEAADWAARYAVDGLQGTGWRSADDDPRPVLHLELRRPVKADLLLLSHAADFRFPDPRHLGRALRVEVLLNGAKKGVLAELVADDRRKSAIDLGPARTIRVLEIRVLESSPGVDGADGVGFNEIELLRK
ncbi:MAG: hypothetical protein H8E31_05665, partial [Planctomycetes bacterium]|nr:hypothetical protein [Planctomycetota bacterium]